VGSKVQGSGRYGGFGCQVSGFGRKSSDSEELLINISTTMAGSCSSRADALVERLKGRCHENS
jgi:hypothetical protein